MKEEDIITAIIFVAAVFLLGCWFYQDEIKALWYLMDTAMLGVLQFIPFLGDRYAGMLSDYRAVQASWPSYWQYLVVGQSVWRPFMIMIMMPMCFLWAFKSKKKRDAQGFDNIDKAYIDKHYRTLEPSQATRQQWTVRHWFHHYDLHKLPWGSEAWEDRINAAFRFQLGPASNTPSSRELITEFAGVVRKELIESFGKDKPIVFDVKEVVELAIERHHYLTPAMVRILGAARDDYGVVSPYPIRNRLFEKSEWIPIWFSLNGLGRQTTHIESLGALSHFYVEVAYNEPLEEPQFRNAIKGLDQYREHLLDQLKMHDLDESENYQLNEEEDAELPRYNYSLDENEQGDVLGRSG